MPDNNAAKIGVALFAQLIWTIFAIMPLFSRFLVPCLNFFNFFFQKCCITRKDRVICVIILPVLFKPCHTLFCQNYCDHNDLPLLLTVIRILKRTGLFCLSISVRYQ